MAYKSMQPSFAHMIQQLPAKAQKIFKVTFYKTWRKSIKWNKPRIFSREEIAHRLAWSAVKKKYEKKTDGHWERK